MEFEYQVSPHNRYKYKNKYSIYTIGIDINARLNDYYNYSLIDFVFNAGVAYGKYKFEQEKREKMAKKNSAKVENKEVQMSMQIAKHDMETKAKQVQKFISCSGGLLSAVDIDYGVFTAHIAPVYNLAGKNLFCLRNRKVL